MARGNTFFLTQSHQGAKEKEEANGRSGLISAISASLRERSFLFSQRRRDRRDKDDIVWEKIPFSVSSVPLCEIPFSPGVQFSPG